MRLLPVAILSAFLLTPSGSASPLSYEGEQFTLSANAEDPASLAGKVSWKDCGAGQMPVHIGSLEVSPDPPKPGQNMTVKVNAETTRTIQEGSYAEVTVKMGLVVLLKKTFDVCEEARNNNASIQCPVVPGKYTLEEVIALPKEIPRVKFNVGVKGYAHDDEPMMCLSIDADFRPFLSGS